MPEIEPPDERGLSLLRVIVARIMSGEIRKDEPETFLTASEAMALLGKPGPWKHVGLALKHNGLASLEKWTARHDALPKVSALIVYKHEHTPRKGFLKSNGWEYNSEGLDWWRKEANRAITFDWTPWAGIVRYKRVMEDFHDLRVREDEPLGQIDVSTVPARLRKIGVTVSEVLRWMAAGQTEADILREHRELRRDDIRASLAYAAGREERSKEGARKMSRLAAVTENWGGKFTLPKSDPDDPRMDYLLKKYWRYRE